MKAKLKFITIEFDNVPGIYDYPMNIPLPRVGDTVVFEVPHHGGKSGKVYDVRHIVTGNVADIKLKVSKS